MKLKSVCILAGISALVGPQSSHGALVLDDALQGSTTGTRSGGAFVAGGWQATGKDDTLYWHVPTIAKGAVEFDVRGLQANERRAGMEDKTELFRSNVKVWNLARQTNVVRLNGKSLCDDAGPFLGLGVSYFQALRHAKFDRDWLDRNLGLLAAKGFNYVRILSMVSWDGLEIVRWSSSSTR